MKAKYIAFEGVDGSGKTKQLSLLVNYLNSKGAKVLVTKEFGSPHNDACVKMREFALNSSYNFDELAGQFMFAACSSQHSERVITPNLSEYDYIISDRSIESNLAYCEAIGYDRDLVHTLFFLDKRRVHPDTVVYLNVDPELTWSRINKRDKETFTNGGVDRIEDKGLAFQRKVSAAYSRRISENSHFLVIDCTTYSIEQTHQEILKRLEV
jgi:dTMP kinase